MGKGNAMKKQEGVALLVCLMILLILSVMGIVAMRMMSSQAMMAIGSQASDISFQAAETGINRAIVVAETDVVTRAILPVLPGPEHKKTTTFQADDKGVSTISVSVSMPDIAGDPAASQRAMQAIAAFGSVPGAVIEQFRFESTGTVGAVDVATTHVQDTIFPHL